MALSRVRPIEVRVRADWFSGRPRSVEVGGRELTVIQVAAVRREVSAYPAVSGPRTVFEVETPGARLALSFAHRSRRWTLEGLEAVAA